MDEENISQDAKYQIKLISLISLAIFLFVLFFQPFDFQMVDFNDRMIFTLGFAVITFLILVVFRIILPVSVTSRIRAESLKISNEVGLIILIWIFIACGNIFYIHYVGKVDMDLSSAVVISLFSAFPSIILKLADVNMSLRKQLLNFVRRNIKLEHDLANAEQQQSEPVILMSDTQTDKIELLPDDIMLIKSADNYVEIYYKTGDEVEHKLLRNTLKNMQQALRDQPDFRRCHRTCIVNTACIVSLTNSYKGHRIKMLDIDEEIPVSRQYILGIKDVLDAE
ncbi:MAG: LytTR family DNA-binding domain-containing protein [Bacteroidales bacterium]|nr:LytTR family DNA-binding domain-containing protein [Bacteroidales bacterium]MDT8432654.1 LytTR family DNA-binding domain-containing protein [Bacteroidales bacterium]